MDHPNIEDQNVVDRYLAGELSADDEARFEEHLFACADCLEQVEAGEDLRLGMREVAAQDTARAAQVTQAAGLGFLAWLGRRRGLWAAGLTSLGLVAGLLVAALFQGAPGPTETGAPSADLAFVSLGVVRGAEPVTVSLDPARPWVLLSVELPPGVADSYAVSLIDDEGDGGILWRDDAVAPDPYDALTVVVPSSFLAPGRYRVRVAASGSTEVTELPLVVL